ncbi:MAG TPA: EAL domain-containing protein [Telmatospirillum sp.]|nr:EAL domain-containing protein [Telmatospirillum sp.]
MNRFIRDHFSVLCSFCCLAAAISSLFVLQMRQINTEVAEQARQNVIEANRAFATVVTNTVVLVDGLLKSVRYVYEMAGPDAVKSFLADEHPSGTAIAYFAVAAPNGNGFLFGDPERKTVNLSDRPHFQAQQDVVDDDLFVGQPNIGRLSNKLVIPFTRGLHQPSGRLAGMVMAGIEPNLLSSRFFDPTKLGPHGIIAVFGMDGVFRAHGKNAPDWLGRKVSDQSPMWEKLKEADQGLYWQTSTIDGDVRLYCYEKLKDYPLVVITGISKDDILDWARARRLPYQRAFAIVLGLLLIVFILVLRQRMSDVDVRQDRERLAEALSEIERHVYLDALTGLPNRVLMQDRLAQAIETARRDHTQVALLFIDLDGFKMVNDTFGHDVGDDLLKHAADLLRQCLRHSDTIARLGGDEFILILPKVDSPDEVAEVAEKVIAQLGKTISLDGRLIRLGASVGIALFPDDGPDVTTLMKIADSAMYQAKAAGRNTFRFFDMRTMEVALDRLKLETDLHHATLAGEYELHYQPKICLNSGRVQGVEALVRWNSKDRGLVFPDQFIPLAEETGLIVEIGDWVLKEACRQMVQWETAGLGRISVAVNVSTRQLFDDSFVTEVARLLAQYHLAPSRIEIELTESAVMTEPERAISQLQRLKDIGVGISVDDFGTGYSSLSYLKRLPLSNVKIDKTFVHGVDRDTDNAAIVAAVLGLARTLDLSVIAEGIETEEEERHLQSAGCLIGQGYRYARPLPAAAFTAWLTSRKSERPLAKV